MSLKTTLFVSICTAGLVAGASAANAQDAAPANNTTVIVQGKTADVVKRIDRRVYRTGSDIQSSTGSAADVLNDIPSVDVDADGNVSLRGDGKVTILIDGKPAAQVSGAAAGDGLKQIPADQIDRVEVVTNPSAQFKADGTGVINIILKKPRKDVSTGTMQASIGNQGRYNVSTTGAVTLGRLTLSGRGSLRHDQRFRRITDSRTQQDSSGQTIVNTHLLPETAYRLMPSLSGTASYATTERDKVTASVSWGERYGQRYFTQQDQTFDAANAPLKGSERFSDGKEWRIDLQQSLGYDHTFRRDGETVSLNLQRSIVREREDYLYTNTYRLPAGPQSHDTLHLGLDLVDTDFTIDYVLPLANERMLKLGYDFTRDDNGFDNSGTTRNEVTGTNVVNPDVTNDFRYYQAVHAAYATYQTRLGAIDILGGLRVEDTTVRTHQITGDQTHEMAYFRAYPSLHLSYSLSDAERLTASFATRVSRPDPEDVNPFSDHQDTHNLRAGNPDLKPQETQSFEVGYSYDAKDRSYSATGYWRNIRNAVTDITQVISDDVILSTKTNLPHSRSAGVEFGASGKLLPKLGYNLSGNVFYNEVDTSAFGGPGTRSTVSANSKASLDFKPTIADTWQVSGNYTGRRLTAQGYVLPIFTLNLGYRRQLRSDLAMVATFSDALNSQKFRRVIDVPGLQDRYTRLQGGQVFYLGLSYTGSGPRKSKTTFEYDQ